MTRIDKLINKFLEKPESLSLKEIEKILFYLGFIKSQGKGSHIHYGHPQLNFKIVIPVHDNECKKYYKKRVSKEIRRLMGKA